MEDAKQYQKDLVDRAIYLRGRIVAAYSQVEFLLADISVKLDLRFPYLIKDRLKAVKRISEREGYQDYKVALDAVCANLLKYDDLRRFMAHGFMTLVVDAKRNHLFELRIYERTKEGEFSLVLMTTTLSKLERAAEDITAYVSETVLLFGQLYRDKRLEA